MNERLRRLPWIEICIILVAIVLRFALLDIKPAHFDEGINGWWADQMKRTGYYHYDPTNYHGPLHFYAVYASQTLFGRNLWALRLPAIIASLLAVWMTLRFSRFLGRPAALLAAAAMAISPGFVFYGRYSIHESWQVFFGLMLMWGMLGLWKDGRRKDLFAVIAGLTGMILTKETYLLHAGCMLLAGGTLWAWSKVIPSRDPAPWAKQEWTKSKLGGAMAASVVAIVTFYSGFYQDLPALRGIVDTFATWVHTGVDAAGHEKTAYQIGPLNYYWLALMARYEWPALGGFLFCFVLIGRMEAYQRYLAIYGCGALLAYSIIPYKTPWCVISLLWPFLLLFGCACVDLGRRSKLATIFLGAVLFTASTVQMIRLNFFHYTDEKEPYVYVQTYTDINRLIQPVLEAAKRDPRAYAMRGQILLGSYYPIPWILGDFTDVGYFNRENEPANLDGDFIAIEKSRNDLVEGKLTEPYYKEDFRLRDAQEECTVYFKKSEFEKLLPAPLPPLVGPN